MTQQLPVVAHAWFRSEYHDEPELSIKPPEGQREYQRLTYLADAEKAIAEAVADARHVRGVLRCMERDLRGQLETAERALAEARARIEQLEQR